MRIKPGVDINGLKPEILIALMIAQSVYQDYGAELVLTCGVEADHSPKSLHYVGLAIDIGISSLSRSSAVKISSDLSAKLSDQFDIVLENDHIHIEFQPKENIK